MTDAKTKLCCVIGNPVEQSISPAVHNAAYKTLGLNYVFLAFNVVSLKKAIEGLKSVGVTGISVTIPHKLEVLKYVDEIDEVASKIGASNTIVNKNGYLTAGNTDWIGAVWALEEKTSLVNKQIALLGAGGAARAIAYGLSRKGSKISVFNRNLENANLLVRDFKLKAAYSLNETSKISAADIIINATPVGMFPHVNESPIPFESIKNNHLIFDVVFKPNETKLIEYAKRKGAKVVYGYKMLLYQAVEQFKLFTGKEPPISVMEKAIC